MEEKRFDRGSPLSIFRTDRMEDVAALLAALLIAVSVVLVVGHG
ncbi:hypothetical protein [Candidatus Magnetaquicoccus inordinatus]|nr:hypothetical protein [Candidatus Magnetaquicoccus inordinatus]